MRMGVPPSSVNCLVAAGFFAFGAGSRGHARAQARSRNDHNHLHSGLQVYEGGGCSSNRSVWVTLCFLGGSHKSIRFLSGSTIQAKWRTRQFRVCPSIELSGSSPSKKNFASSNNPFHPRSLRLQDLPYAFLLVSGTLFPTATLSHCFESTGCLPSHKPSTLTFNDWAASMAIKLHRPKVDHCENRALPSSRVRNLNNRRSWFALITFCATPALVVALGLAILFAGAAVAFAGPGGAEAGRNSWSKQSKGRIFAGLITDDHCGARHDMDSGMSHYRMHQDVCAKRFQVRTRRGRQAICSGRK